MKQKKPLVAVTTLLLLVSLITITSYIILNKETKQDQDKEFYIGVTYCGSSVEAAKELVDKVKNYTNFFTLLS